MSLVLKHNATAVDLAAAHCELGSLVRSFLGPWTLTLRRSIAFDEPTDWQNEDAIVLERDGTVVFEGTIKSSERVASAEGEEIVYACVGLRQAADAVTFQRTIGGTATARVVYNCPTEEQAEEFGYVANAGEMWTVGEILADILDAMAAELAGVIGTGAQGSGYVEAELDALAPVPGKVVLNGRSVDEAIAAVLAHAPDFGYCIDPAAHQARFYDFRELTPKEVPGVGDAVLRQQLEFSTAKCFSACTVQGTYEQVDVFEQLTPAWDSELEDTWTSDLAKDYPDSYGLVWRLFATSEPAAEGGAVMPQRFVGGGDIAVVVAFGQFGECRFASVAAQVYDDTKLLLDKYGRQWSNEHQRYEAADVYARFTYRKDRVTGRYPAAGHTGSAYTQRGLERELVLIDEERGKKTLKGVGWGVLSTTEFIGQFVVCVPDELVGKPIEFNDDGVEHTIAGNKTGIITLAEAPETPVAKDDTFVITVQDDTLKEFESGTLSILEKYAKETLERVMDERLVGDVPLAGLDWAIALGQKISFTGTNDPEYGELGATLVAVEHDLARRRTVLSLTSDRAFGGTVSWSELEQQRRRDRAIDENTIQIRRLWRRLRNRRAEEGAKGDPHEKDPDGPYAGDDVWIDIDDDKIVGHIGPGPVDQHIGGEGKFIQWIDLDARGHLVDAGVGTFS
jgi:hypothetical protein